MTGGGDRSPARGEMLVPLFGLPRARTSTYNGRVSDDRTADATRDDGVAAGGDAAVTEPRDGGAPARPAIDVGATVGRYHLRERLGEGGMGVVYAAYDPGLDREVAVKVLRPGVGDDADEPHLRLQREARVMARLSHPNVMPVHDVGYAAGSIFVAMELVRGGTLTAWLETPRPPDEILARFVAAGRGLAAAHDAGFVHRDFKPSNVMVGEGGRVLVTDFGLARALGDDRAAVAAEVDAAPLDVTLTRDNAIVGTPAYMAPEQHRGGAVDARADQFSFCVALWHALYGAPPFAGASWRELAAAVTEGRLVEPPPTAAVPPRVRAALTRGLAADPAARWPSMHALLDALAPPRSRRIAWIAGAAGLAAIAVVAIALGGGDDAGDPCAAEDDRFAGVWDAEARAAVERAFAATNLPYAAAAFDEVARQLDARQDAWVAMRHDSCVATRVRREQSDAAMDLRGACLDRALGEIDAFVDVLRGADAKVVETAPGRAATVGDVAACADVAALQRRAAPAPEVAAEVRALEAELARVRAAIAAQRDGAVAGEVDALLARARDTLYAPVHAEALAVAASVAQLAERPAEAEPLLEQAVLAAEAGGDDVQRFDLEVRLVDVVGYLLEREADGRRHAERAEALRRRLGAAPERDARLALALSRLEWTHGRYDAARDQAARAIELLERIGPGGYDLARALHMLSIVHDDRNDPEAGLPIARRALEVAEDAVGADHPLVGRVVMTVGNHLRRLDRLDDAEAAYRRALAIYERTSGPRSTDVAMVQMNLGNLRRDRDDLPGAIAAFRAAAALFEEISGPEHTRTANAVDNLASAVSEHGDAAGAEPLFRRAIEIYTARIGADAPPTAGVIRRFAEHHLRHGEPALAVPLLEQVVAALERQDDPRQLVRPLARLGEAYLAVDDARRAHATFERCLTAAADDAYHEDQRAQCRFGLARALRLLGRDPARARTLAEQARATWAQWSDGADDVAAVDAWLRAR